MALKMVVNVLCYANGILSQSLAEPLELVFRQLLLGTGFVLRRTGRLFHFFACGTRFTDARKQDTGGFVAWVFQVNFVCG